MKLTSQVVTPDSSASIAADVVFIHGTGSNSEMWAPQVKALVEIGYRCFLIDLRGHGATAEAFETTDIKVHLNDVMETLSELPVRYPATFVGHSLGAIISLELAQMHPEMFDQIFAVGMPGRVLPPVVSLFGLVLKLPYEKLRGTALHKALPWRLKTLINTDRFTLSQIAANFKGLDYVSRPFNISCPVHFSAGRFDPVAPFNYVKQMQSALPHSTLEVFDIAGHNHMDQYPDRFNRWLLGALRK